jgi:ribonuclease P protein component
VGLTAVDTVNDTAAHKVKPEGSFLFPRTARLLKPNDFKRVFKNSSASSDRYFKVLSRPNGGEVSRLGLAVSKKVDKRAVGRNRIKRLARESFRCTFETVSASPTNDSGTTETAIGLDLVVLPRHISASICNQQLTASLESHWRRLKEKSAKRGAPTDQEAVQPDRTRVKQTAGRK